MPTAATSAAGIPPTSPWSAMHAWRPSPAGGAAADANAERPFRSDETLRFLAASTSRRDFQPANTPRTVDPRVARRGAREAAAGNRNLVYDAGNFLGIVPYLSRAGPGPLQADQRLRLDRPGLRHGAGRGQGAARRDHRAGHRRRRLPDDHGRARDGGARGPAAGHRA